MFLFGGAAAGVRCAMVCRRGRGWCPGRYSWRFTIYRIIRCRRQSPNSRRISSRALAHSMNMPRQVGLTPQIQFKTSIFQGFSWFIDGTILTVTMGRDGKTVVKMSKWNRGPFPSTISPTVNSYRPIPSRKSLPLHLTSEFRKNRML